MSGDRYRGNVSGVCLPAIGNLQVSGVRLLTIDKLQVPRIRLLRIAKPLGRDVPGVRLLWIGTVCGNWQEHRAGQETASHKSFGHDLNPFFCQ